MKLRHIVSSVVAVAAVLSFVVARAGDRTAKEEFEKGKESFDEKTYKKALEHFGKARELGVEAAWKDELTFRVGVSHLRLRQWNEAEKELKAAAQGAGEWRLRSLIVAGQMYRDWPHEVYEKDGVKKRGEWFDGASYVYTENEDWTAARDAFETAKALLYELRAKEDGKTLKDLQCEVNFDLAEHVMGRMQRGTDAARWKDPAGDTKAYDPKWTDNEKVVFLLDEVANVDPSEKKTLAGRAMQGKAMYVMRRNWWFEIKPEDDVPGAAIEVLRAAIKAFPQAPNAGEMQYSIGRIREDQARFVEARAEYKLVVDQHGDSKWESDALGRIQEIQRPLLALAGSPTWLPEQKVELATTWRNVKQVACSLKTFDAQGAFERFAEKGEDNFRGGDFTHSAAFSKKLPGDEVRSWTIDTADDGRHLSSGGKVELGALKPGAYVLSMEANGIRISEVILVSDVVLVERIATTTAEYMLVDAKTGDAVTGASVRVVERTEWWENSQRRVERNLSDLKTDADGRAQAKLKWTDRGSQFQAFAKLGDRIAATGQAYHYHYGEGGRSPRIYAYTDRPVYRPAQVVHFKATARVTNETGYALPKDRNVQVVVRDPRGTEIFSQAMQMNEFGSVSGSVKLGEEPPLGWYGVQITAAGVSGNCNFGVEEYKKPEFEVTVVSKTEQAKLGDGLTAEIRADYYFGGGVPEADVHYTVTRSTYRYWWREAEEFDWFTGGWDGPDRDWDEEVVLDGRGKTDEKGALLIEWSTQKAMTEMGDRDHEYEIHAEVTDASRRTIEGGGSVRVTRTQMFATLATRRGFYTAGDHVELELNTQNANHQPLASEGAVTVARMRWDSAIQPNGGWAEDPFLTEPAKTGADGRGFWKWQSDSEGYYAFTYDTKDAWEQKVQAKVFVNVASPDGGGRQVRFQGVELHPERRTWKPEETARLLLTSDRENATVWVTIEAQQSILKSEVWRLNGKTKIVEIPISAIHCPNFFVRAVTIHGGTVHHSIVELFAPPADKFVDVTLTPSKKEYLPGEKARYDIVARDWKGNPVSAEIGLTVFDKSVLYIRPENVGDVRLWFYGGRRGASVTFSTSRQFSTSPRQEDKNEYEKHVRHGDPIGWHGGSLRRRGHGGAWGGESEGATTGAADPSAPAGGAIGSPESDKSDHNESGDREDLKKLAEGKDGRQKQQGEKGKNDDGKPGQQDAPKVRKNFADTAYWTPFATTDASGKATVEFDMPDSLTAWKATARAIDRETKVGAASVEVVTRKLLMARLQAPRFFRERDELVISAIVNNASKVGEKVTAKIVLEGGTLELDGTDTFEFAVSANGEYRVDWKVKAVTEGTAKITVSAIGQQDSDAMQMEFPVLVHGMDKLQGWSGVVKGETETATLTFDVPEDRKISTTDLVAQVSPTMLGALLDSLPYLIEYPYGCVEQTMSRFLPAVAVANTLKTSGVSLEEIGKKRRLAYANVLPAKDPVFHTQALQHIVDQGLARLYGFQNGMGGWGWWQSDKVDPFITAYVVNGLRIAKEAGAPVDPNVLARGIAALKGGLEKEEDLHRAMYCAYVLAECGALDKKPREHLYMKRGDANSYGRALLAMAMFKAGDKDKAEVCIRNMEDFVKVDPKLDVAWWDREERWSWWYWHGDDVEGNSAILRAYCMVDPKNANVPRLAKWLLMNRDGVRWKSTRDTAHAILALCEFAKVSGELAADYTVEISLDGKPLKSFKVTAENVFTLEGEAALRGDAVESGKHTLTVTKTGKGTAYWSVFLGYFSTEEDLKAGGSKLAVTRTYYRLLAKKVETNENGRKVTRIEYEREKLASGATVTSGDLLEIEIAIEAPNDYEYLVFEDMKAAGVEPTEVTSGPVWGTIVSNREFRDEKVAMFTSWLSRGTHKVSYRARAEIPGSFHAMPVNGYAMYAPSVKAISDEFRLNIVDKPKDGGEK